MSLNRRKIQQHFILTLGRSGSNNLVNLLNQHPDLLNIGEVLGEWTALGKANRMLGRFKEADEAYLDRLIGDSLLPRALLAYRSLRHYSRGDKDGVKAFNSIRSIGVKEFSLNMKKHGLEQYLTARPNLKVIGLRRENIVDRFISVRMLHEAGVVKLYAGETLKPKTIRVDPQTIADELGIIERENHHLRAMLESLPAERRFDLTYEELFDNEEKTIAMVRQIYAFLGVKDFAPEVKMQRIIRGRSTDVVENRAACAEALKGTRFEGMFG